MIIVQDILKDVVSKLPKIDLKDDRRQFPVFGWGVKDECNRFLDEVKNKSYPLIWMMPGTNNHSVGQVSRKTEIIIAVNFKKEDEDWNNEDRLEHTFKTILYPLLDSFLLEVNRNHNMSFDNTDYSVTEYPNYHLSSDDNKVIDLWDALTISIDAIYYNKCKI